MDKRSSTRKRSLLNARIIFNNRCSVIECTIRDISETGAKILFAHPHPIPPEFELDIPSRGSSPVRARVMWSNGKECGVLFDSRMEASGSAGVINTQEDPHARDSSEHLVPLDVQAIVDEARQRIARLSGVSLDAVTLTVHIGSLA